MAEADKFARVWTVNNETKVWTFFDPRPKFVRANNLLELVTGNVYWVEIEKDQSVALNGTERSPFSGWM